MAFSKITLTFNESPEVDEYIRFEIVTPYGTTNAIETCKPRRIRPKEFQINEEIGQVDFATQFYWEAWKVDYNATNLYDVTWSHNTVTIEAKADNYTFQSFSSDANVTALIENKALVVPFEYQSVEYSEKAGNSCNQVVVTVTFSSEITEVISPVVITGNTGNTVSFDYVRGADYSLVVTNGEIIHSGREDTPPFLEEPVVNVVNTPSGATANIITDLSLSPEYSLNGVDWQTTSVFPSLLEGTYVAYVRDKYGCLKTAYFDVDEFTEQVEVTKSVAYISNTNAIRYKEDEVWDNKTIYKTDSNTLSCEENVKTPNKYVQKYQASNIIPTQIKTNYTTVSARARALNGSITQLSVVKKTNNIGLKDKRDALGYSFSDGRYGFYYISGKTYDYNTGAETGTYELFGGKPFWAKIGQYLLVDDTTYFKVVDIVYEKEINAQVLVIDGDLSGSLINKTTATIYNVFPWDAYEFNVDMASFVDLGFYIEIELRHDDFGIKKYKSEYIHSVSGLPENFAEIKYKHSENTDILFSTGIEYLLNLQYIAFGLKNETEIDIHKTDNSVYKLSGTAYHKKQLILSPVTTMMARKITQIGVLDNIKINNVPYVIENVEEPKRIGLTNLYRVNIDVYESKSEIEKESTQSVTPIELDVLEIPNLIDSGDGFIEQ